MRVVRTHNMTQAEAKQWIDERIPDLLTQFGRFISDPEYGWTDYSGWFSFNASIGGNVAGTLEVTETQFIVDAPPRGLVQRGFDGKARTTVEVWFDENMPT